MRSRSCLTSSLFVLLILAVTQVVDGGTFSAASKNEAKRIKNRVFASTLRDSRKTSAS